jgi:hypothetical protein
VNVPAEFTTVMAVPAARVMPPAEDTDPSLIFVTPVLVTVTSPVVVFTSIPPPADTEVTRLPPRVSPMSWPSTLMFIVSSGEERVIVPSSPASVSTPPPGPDPGALIITDPIPDVGSIVIFVPATILLTRLGFESKEGAGGRFSI